MLNSSDLLHLSDFDELAVADGLLAWRLVRSTANHYVKALSSYDDDDKTNDPAANATCVTGDIAGMCTCDFSDPVLEVTLEGTFPI